MSSFSLIVSRAWDLYVTNAVLAGWCMVQVNTYNTSLLLAWMVSLCDLVYITDVFARSTKRVHRSAVTANLALLFDYTSASLIFELFASFLKIWTFVPYHVLVICDLDMSSVYFLVCVLRVARLWKSGRLNIVSTFSDTEKHEHITSRQKKTCMQAAKRHQGKANKSSPKQERSKKIPKKSKSEPVLAKSRDVKETPKETREQCNRQ